MPLFFAVLPSSFLYSIVLVGEVKEFVRAYAVLIRVFNYIFDRVKNTSPTRDATTWCLIVARRRLVLRMRNETHSIFC